MAGFIVDLNIPVREGSCGYPSWFFRDMNGTSKHHVFYGGSSYMHELSKKEVLQRILRDWVTVKKASRVDRESVDEFEARLRERVIQKLQSCPRECNDLHIIALSAVAKCNNILTNDNGIALCKSKIRDLVGHNYCPNIKLVKSENVYRDTV